MSSEFAHDHDQKTRLLAELRSAEAEIARLRTDLAALRDGINQYAAAAPDERGDLYHRLFALMIAESPGAAALAELGTALEQALAGLAAEQELRARSEMIVLAARHIAREPNRINQIALEAEFAAYDAAVQARDG